MNKTRNRAGKRNWQPPSPPFRPFADMTSDDIRKRMAELEATIREMEQLALSGRTEAIRHRSASNWVCPYAVEHSALQQELKQIGLR